MSDAAELSDEIPPLSAWFSEEYPPDSNFDLEVRLSDHLGHTLRHAVVVEMSIRSLEASAGKTSAEQIKSIHQEVDRLLHHLRQAQTALKAKRQQSKPSDS